MYAEKSYDSRYDCLLCLYHSICLYTFFNTKYASPSRCFHNSSCKYFGPVHLFQYLATISRLHSYWLSSLLDIRFFYFVIGAVSSVPFQPFLPPNLLLPKQYICFFSLLIFLSFSLQISTLSEIIKYIHTQLLKSIPSQSNLFQCLW